jgi:hypothetical protein
MDVEDRRAKRETAERRFTGSADAGRGHVHHAPHFEPDGSNAHTPQG